MAAGGLRVGRGLPLIYGDDNNVVERFMVVCGYLLVFVAAAGVLQRTHSEFSRQGIGLVARGYAVFMCFRIFLLLTVLAERPREPVVRGRLG